MTRSLVVGAHGLLGRAVTRELAARGHIVRTAHVRWGDGEAARQDLRAAVLDLLDSTRDDGWAVWWCAGAGVTSTSQTALHAEFRVTTQFCDDLRRAAVGSPRGSVFFASSAGGVYGGSQPPPFTEETEPAPLADYGKYKLRSEAEFRSLSEVASVAIARIANLYGPGQDLSKPQGLISQLCVAHHRGAPLNVYVSLDTLRDYIYVEDAARLVIDFCETVGSDCGDRAVTKILASGRSVSIGAVLGEMKRIFKRRVPVVLAASPYARQQARDLRLHSVVLPDLDARPHLTLAAGIHATAEEIGLRFRASG